MSASPHVTAGVGLLLLYFLYFFFVGFMVLYSTNDRAALPPAGHSLLPVSIDLKGDINL